jgi:hypothetical protein
VAAVKTDDVVHELVNRLLEGKRLLPMPGAPQDLALLAFVIDKQHVAFERVRTLHVRQPHYPYCEICPESDGWPCPTLRALEER